MVSKELQVKVSANTQLFKQQMESAGSSLNNFNNKLTGVVKAAAIPIASIGLATYAKGIIDAADDLNDLSTITGVAYEKLQLFSNLPDLKGFGAEDLAKTFKGIEKSILEAGDATSKNGKLYKELGIEFKNNDGTFRNAEEVFIDMADAISKLEDSSMKQVLVEELMMKGASKYIPLLNQGSEAIREQIRSVSGLSFVYSKELGESMGEFNDNIGKIGTLVSSFSGSIISGLTTNLAVLTTHFLDSKDAGDELKSIFVGSVKFGGEAAKAIYNVSQGIRIMANTTKLASAGLSEAMALVTFGKTSEKNLQESKRLEQEYLKEKELIFKDYSVFYKRLEENNAKMIESINKGSNQEIIKDDKKTNDKKTQALIDFQNRIRAIMQGTKDAEKPKENKNQEDANEKSIQQLIEKNYQLTYGQEAYDLYKLSIAGATSEQIKQYEALQKINGQAEKEIELKKEASEIIKASQTEQEKYSETLYRYDELMLSGYLSAEQYQKAVLKLNEEFQKSNEKTVKMSEYAKRAAENIQDAFADFLFDPFASSANDMAINFINVIRRIVAEKAALQILDKNFIGGTVDKGLGMLGGLFDFNAGGGYVPSNSLSVVGERGPEIIKGPAYVQDTAGSAYALSQQSNNGKSGNIVINNNINANDMIAFMSSTAGQKVITNAVSANKQKLKGVLR